MLQLVLLSDFLFPRRSDMFEFAFSISKFTSRGPEGMGGVSGQRRRPPHPVKTYLQWQEAKPRTSTFHRDSHDLYFGELRFGLRRTMLIFSLLC